MAMRRPGLIAFAAAALFGASVPLANLLLGGSPGPVSPVLLAGLLYLGAGLGLLSLRLASALASAGRESRILAMPPREQWPALAAAVVCGGLLAPVLLLWGLPGTGSAAASLLLNTESVFTAWLAVQVFSEHVGQRVWAGMLLMLAAGALLTWMPGEWALPLHGLAILAACLLWGLDNNFTRLVSSGDAITIAMVKGLAAGSINLALALSNGAAWPAWTVIGEALLLGALGYGASLALYVIALRHLGSARTGAWFASAPFFGAALSVALGEPLTPLLVMALVLMAAAAWLLGSERHRHRHVHEPLRHAHEHRHDAHHRHAHPGGVPGQPHTHEHEHQAMEHVHEHAPDLHHRHRHR